MRARGAAPEHMIADPSLTWLTKSNAESIADAMTAIDPDQIAAENLMAIMTMVSNSDPSTAMRTARVWSSDAAAASRSLSIDAALSDSPRVTTWR